MTAKVKRPGRGWAYACAQLGGAASIAANVAHSFVPPAGAPEGWTPPAGSVISSVFWPVALFFAIEAFSRVPWPNQQRWVWLRFGGLLPVASVAAVVSYMHLSGLLASYGAGKFETQIGPLAVDGLMVIGTAALIATSRIRQAEAADQVADPTPVVDDLVGPEPVTTGELWERYSDPVDLIKVNPREVYDRMIAERAEADQVTPDPTGMTASILYGTDQAAEIDQVAARRRSDDELWTRFGDQMCQEHIEAEKGITEYRVGKITGADRRQAKRLRVRVIETAGQPEEVSR